MIFDKGFARAPRAPRALGCALLSAASLGVFCGPAQAALTISTGATSNVTCAKGTCTATAAVATLNVGDLQTQLGKKSTKVVPGSVAQDIVVAAPLTWANTNRLTLDGYRSVTVQQPVTITGTGALTVNTNDGGTGGTFSFTSSGYVKFWDLSSSLIVNGNSFTLANSVAGLATAVAANTSGYFALAASYDASPDGTYKHAPVATLDGVFEGLGNTISNLKVSVKKGKTTQSGWDGQAGLFGGVTGQVENIDLAKATVSGGDLTNVGILAGELSGTIANASAAGSATVGNGVGNNGSGPVSPDAGGLVGAMFNDAAVLNSSSTASVTGGGSAIAGGLVGGTYFGGQILNSRASGAVIAGDNTLGGGHGSATGGLVGLIDNDPSGSTTISGDSASGSVTAGGNGECFSGGLIGISLGAVAINLSFATGNVSVGAAANTQQAGMAGGLIGGVNNNSNSVAGTVQQSYATGAVSGAPNDLAGGLVGYTQGAIGDSYATGAQSASGSGFTALGGLVGYVDTAGSVSTSYSTGTVQFVANSWIGGAIGGLIGAATNVDWDTDTSGIASSVGCGNTPNCSGVTGLTTSQLKSGLPGGFSKKVWREKAGVNGGLPYLIALPPG